MVMWLRSGTSNVCFIFVYTSFFFCLLRLCTCTCVECLLCFVRDYADSSFYERMEALSRFLLGHVITCATVVTAHRVTNAPDTDIHLFHGSCTVTE